MTNVLPITYHGQLVATVLLDRAIVATDLAPEHRQTVDAMCVYAGEILEGRITKPYSDEDALAMPTRLPPGGSPPANPPVSGNDQVTAGERARSCGLDWLAGPVGLVGLAVSLARLDELSSRSAARAAGQMACRIGLTARLRLAGSRPCQPTPPHPLPSAGA